MLTRSRTQHLHDGAAKGFDLAADHIATGAADGRIRLLTVDGEHVAEAAAHDDIINAVAVSPGGHLASAGRDRRVRLWLPGERRTYTIGEHDHWVMGVAWSGDGMRVASCSEDGTVAVWEPDGAAVLSIDLGYPVNDVSWQGDLIAAAGGDRSLYLLRPDGEVVRSIPGATQLLWATALSPDGSRVAWTGRDRMLSIADVTGSEPIVVPAHDDQIWDVAWDGAGERIVTASADGTAAVWDAAGRALERVEVGPWVRGARLRDQTLLVTTEEGDLITFEDDGRPLPPPASVVVPNPPPACSHWEPQVEETSKRRCEECGSPDELRLCVTCGHVGCCESQLAHGTKHWLETGHPNTIPTPAGDFAWKWCYADDMYVKKVEG